jgi:hypothetical protein
MSFAFIPNSVKKKKPVLVSSHVHIPSASISVGAQVTSESVDNSRGTKVLAFILLNDILTYLFLRIKPAQNQSKIKSKLMNMLRDL